MPNLNFTKQTKLQRTNGLDSERQNPLGFCGTDKIVKKLKAERQGSDGESDLNDRTMEASIVIKPTLKTQPKHMNNVNAGSRDHMASSRILKARKGGQPAQGGDDRYSDNSSACNLLDSSRSDQGKRSEGGPSSRRRQRYQDESDIDEDQERNPDMNLDSIQDIGIRTSKIYTK